MQLCDSNGLSTVFIRMDTEKSQALIDPKCQGPYSDKTRNKDTAKRIHTFQAQPCSHAEVYGSQLFGGVQKSAKARHLWSRLKSSLVSS